MRGRRKGVTAVEVGLDRDGPPIACGELRRVEAGGHRTRAIRLLDHEDASRIRGSQSVTNREQARRDGALQQASTRNSHGSFYPRDKAPHDALRPSRRARDAEAARLDGGFSVPIRMAAAGQAGPQRLDAVFPPRPPWHRRAHVLDHAELAAGREDATDLGEAARRIADAAKTEAARHSVEGSIPKR